MNDFLKFNKKMIIVVFVITGIVSITMNFDVGGL